MQENWVRNIAVFGFVYSATVVQVQGYVQCGQKLCHGESATCCSWDENECCWMSWYTMWWIWVGVIIATAVIFCMVVCCCSKKRRKSSVRHIILVPPHQSSYYGSITSYPQTSEQPYNQTQHPIKI